MFHKTLAGLMKSLGYDRTNAAKLRQRHGLVFPKTALGYSEPAARAALEAAGVACPLAPSTGADACEPHHPAPSGSLQLPGECSYDELIKSGEFPLAAAHKREQIREQEILNDIRRVELARLRGDLVPKAEVTAKIERVTLSCIEALASLPDIYAATLPADERPAGRKAARGWVDEVRSRMAQLLRKVGEPQAANDQAPADQE